MLAAIDGQTGYKRMFEPTNYKDNLSSFLDRHSSIEILRSEQS